MGQVQINRSLVVVEIKKLHYVVYKIKYTLYLCDCQYSDMVIW